MRRCARTASSDEETQKGLNPHIDQTGHGSGGVIRVDRRKNQVTSERSLNGDFRRLSVADFSDHDHVGILTQNSAHPEAKVRPILGLTWICPTPLRSYSIGSSTVMMLRSMELIRVSAA